VPGPCAGASFRPPAFLFLPRFMKDGSDPSVFPPPLSTVGDSVFVGVQVGFACFFSRLYGFPPLPLGSLDFFVLLDPIPFPF